jgi:hypothetical protein
MSSPDDAKANRARVLVNASMQTVYVDTILGGGPSGDNVTLTLGVRLIDHSQSPPQPLLQPTVQLVLPLTTAEAMGQLAHEIAQRMRQELKAHVN